VGILDHDCHYGDGTDDIIRRLGLDFIKHYSFGSEKIEKGTKAQAWLKRLPDIVRTFRKVDLLIYNAGVDAHLDDPLGGVLSTQQLEQRDLLVFRHARHWGLKVCVSLAGGYQADRDGSISRVLGLHDATFKAGWQTY
jgi:acetoin utilization deacetylase AcuC-like enzyme